MPFNYSIFFILFLFLFFPQCTSQSQKLDDSIIPSPKREMRAVWIVTLDNKDFPSKPNLSVTQQKSELRSILDFHVRRGINAIFFQVRPSADAFYKSKYELWSEWLCGKQGKSPETDFDPLAYIIEEAHKRNMELHAWFNPYRAIYRQKKSSIAPNHITKLQPNWFLEYNKQIHFNPGLPEVRKYLINIIMDVVKRYDIDGVHFDDYFYPYKINNKEFPDEITYQNYKGKFTNLADWRRSNVDILIKTIHDSLQIKKPYVKLGISPFGVWRNKSEDSRGSNTEVGQTCYDVLGADVRKWLENGWIDYVAPQLYWHIGHKKADYKELVNWWAKNSFNRHVYIGQAFYKIRGEEGDQWQNKKEIPLQINLNRSIPEISGSAYFRAKSLMDNYLYVTDTIHQKYYYRTAMIPTMPWKDNTPPETPQNLKKIYTEKRVILKWETAHTTLPQEKAVYYVVYRFEEIDKKDKDEKIIDKLDFEDAKNIVSIQRETIFYEKLSDKKYKYFVSAVDRLHNESKAIEVVE
ncbi:MAG: hypothetical protein EAZ44_10975 [Cytophagia bacterium]|nr:MAG: hypothetical protein EAZ44_10975 [Cytophagia bacterium]TAG42322.1 MAG: hypothetical protein EAZ31_06330 [Cytophagia bacterium]